jgi:hypothetical protein
LTYHKKGKQGIDHGQLKHGEINLTHHTAGIYYQIERGRKKEEITDSGYVACSSQKDKCEH